ncbi:DHH family phosphoesterase [Caldanaerobacter subterraneus]|uniref:Cyclic-di-AMP phosphodiesterase n=4 Tax=Caldanaerobacter subterraneus TaxID=911092 RepID=Q8R6M6_CALS4|nr:DHH family phosphoesterase [Caldanaerobacter subterraneus]AAM25880.1 Exopolyphosphatase-related proteins [Caldanaerobacter subterraneus subsp. tengcongensis MB4]ERM91623.1 exopolyphosphatase [Caldanaerobacter subterraneus subsp. yonseiensis KB-1]MCS3917235.1 c-di-AMP phosphodiesterase-like protein [Caldanaerobacter subterraneus subsp. tengcongensis MB4]TCO64216.1 c-di-AMP phosphodiesterase-like protein [Caldanaerobacter subterraneus]
MDKKFYRIISSINILNLLLSAFLIGFLFYYNKIIASISFIILLYILLAEYYGVKRKKIELDRYIEDIFFSVDKASKTVLAKIPLPAVILNDRGEIIWYNTHYSQTFNENEEIKKLIKKYVTAKTEELKGQIEFNGRYYSVLKIESSFKKKREGDTSATLLFFDDTDYVQLKKSLATSRPVVAHIMIDNYEEALMSVEDVKRAVISSEIEKKLSEWASSIKAFLKKYDDDKYFAIFKEGELKKLEENRFDILDKIRETGEEMRVLLTLSIGVGAEADDFLTLNEYASSALDLALGRGGDQAVVKRGDKISFYGGRTQAVEKRTRVKARVIAHALRELIKESSTIFIMGHNFMDFDSLGAAIGMYRACADLGKKAYIILDKSNVAIDELVKKIKATDGYQDLFIKSSEVKNMIDENSLLIVVDTHRPSYLSYPEIVELIDRIVVIDHHRRGKEFIDKAVLVYLEPYASSASELVTEILQYIVEKVDLKPIEAEALLAGIAVDTKNFTFRTGSRTFEAASFLRKKGADTTSVKQLFQNDLASYIIKATIVKNAEILDNGIAIAISPPAANNLIIAQAADELLTIKGVKASFVLLQREEDVAISGRSMGDVNVQIILEKLGGGGHLTVAGAQVKKPMEEVLNELKQAIKEYFEEEGEDR